jgi:hypothetical protein
MTFPSFIQRFFLSLLVLPVIVALSWPAQGQAKDLVAELFQSIHYTQLDQPESYFWSEAVFAEVAQARMQSAQSPSDCAMPSAGQVHGVALHRGLPFDYAIDLDSGHLEIVYGGQKWDLSRDDLIDDHGVEWVLPCVTPVTALICLGGAAGAGGYCMARVAACEASARNCECGVRSIDCGVCGEGRGVECAPCSDWLDPPDLFWSWRR